MSAYLHRRFLQAFKGYRPRVILECGSRDGLDAIAMYKQWHPAVIYSFEPNPESIPVCEHNTLENPCIFIIHKAVCDKNGTIDFYATDMEKSIDKNIGASSALFHRDNEREFFQKKITVESIRLDTFCEIEKIENIDLLCMDLQGGEMAAIEGLGNKINDVKYIILEMSFESYYIGDYLFDDIDRVLINRGFKWVASDGKVKERHKGFVNCMYKNKSI